MYINRHPQTTGPFNITRNMSNSNPALDRNTTDVQVEYEVSLPINFSSIRHTPYHSLWDLHQW